MKILGIESSALVASVAIWVDGVITAEYTVNFKKTHSQTLLPMIDEIFRMTEQDKDSIDAIAIAAGPGSFTGLRIGSATAILFAEKGWNVAGFELENDYSLFFDCQGIRVVEGYWYGYEKDPEPPMAIKARAKRERTNNARNFIHNLL